MQDHEQNQPDALTWAIPISVAAHLLVVALPAFSLPQALSGSQEEQVVTVELVPPPEPPEPPEAAKPPAPVQETAQSPEPAPARPAKAKASQPADGADRRAPSPAMQPVFQYGERDSGSRKALEGDSAESANKVPAEVTEEAKPEPPPPTASEPAESKVSLVAEPEAADPEPVEDPAESIPLPEARRLFSRSMTDDPVATTAMGKIPRDRRGGTLCGTELREQLIHASYFPTLLPSVRLTSGTVIEVDAAFYAKGSWHAVSYRCGVDAEAMKVVSFAFKVGEPIPRTEWERLGLPSQ